MTSTDGGRDDGVDDPNGFEPVAREALADLVFDRRTELSASLSSLEGRLRDDEPVRRDDLVEVAHAVETLLPILDRTARGFDADVDPYRHLAALADYGTLADLLRVDLEDVATLAEARDLLDEDGDDERPRERDLERARDVREDLATVVRALDARIAELKTGSEGVDPRGSDGE